MLLLLLHCYRCCYCYCCRYCFCSCCSCHCFCYCFYASAFLCVLYGCLWVCRVFLGFCLSRVFFSLSVFLCLCMCCMYLRVRVCGCVRLYLCLRIRSRLVLRLLLSWRAVWSLGQDAGDIEQSPVRCRQPLLDGPRRCFRPAALGGQGAAFLSSSVLEQLGLLTPPITDAIAGSTVILGSEACPAQPIRGLSYA